MKKNSINWIVGIALGAIFLIAWIRIVDWQEFLSYFHEFDPQMVLIFSLFYLFAYFLRSLRWRLILKPIYKMGVMESFTIFMSGMLINYLIPVRAGEIAKSVILKTREKVKISDSLPSIFIDKLTDLFPIILIMILIPLVSVKLNSTLYIIIGLLFFIFLLFLGFLFFAVNHKAKAIRILNFFLKFFPKKYRKKFEDFFINFVDGMAIMNLTYILPTPPAQIGSNQFMWVLIFSFALGVNENLTSAAVTFSHLLTSIWILLIGGISLIALKLNLNQLLQNNNKKD